MIRRVSEPLPIAGLGILPGTIGIHNDSHPRRPEALAAFLDDPRATGPVLTIDDGVALHFVEGCHAGTCKRRENAGWTWSKLPSKMRVC